MAAIEIREYSGDFEDLVEFTQQVWVGEYFGRTWIPVPVAAFLRGRFAPQSDAICLVAYQGAKLVVVTRGAEGAVGYTERHKVTVPSERVSVVDTVGAGDTFDAGILASLKMQNLLTKAQIARLDEQQIGNALALGAKAAAVTVSRAGADPPWAKEIGL